MKGLYIHIPFCKTICSYCDFPKIVAKEKEFEKYLDYLFKELDSKHHLVSNITSVYIGGGTPNILNEVLLEKLLKRLSQYLLSSNENTIEINPELLTENQARLFKKYNINRVSIGVQTLDEDLLKIINRHHNKEIVRNAFYILRNNGITNISCDLMFGIPKQTLDIVKNDLDFIYSLNPKHISYYSLIEEERTVLDYWLRNKKIELLDDDLIADMNDYINQDLKKHGYIHYEVSNYAYSGFESKHNLLYWSEEEYIGIGCGASSFTNKKRITNSTYLYKYYLNEDISIEDIDLEAEKKEYMMLGLRKLEGISISKYRRLYGNPFEDFPLDKLINEGLLVVDGDYLKIPEDKMFLGNNVFVEFV